MARNENRIAVKKTTITLVWPLYGYLDRAIKTGFYGATFTPDVADNYSFYRHWTPEGEFEVRQYPNSMWPLFAQFLDSIWIPKHSRDYFKTRDPSALPHLPRLLPGSGPLPRLSRPINIPRG
jgi:hypothetical protein